MSLTVREKTTLKRMEEHLFFGPGAFMPGKVFHVYPGSSATHLAHIADRNAKTYATVAAAYADAVSGRGDVIVIHGGTHLFTASLAASKHNVTLVGAQALYQNPLLSPSILDMTGTADELINVTGTDQRFIGLQFIGTTAQVCIDFTSAAHRLYFERCHWDMETAAVSTSTIGLKALGAAKQVMLKNCSGLSDGAQGPWLDLTATLSARVTDCRVMHTAGTWAAVILTGAATSGLLIDHSEFGSYGTAVTVGIDGTGATIAKGVSVRYCNFGNLYTKEVDNYDAGECELIENYKAGVGSTDGGTKTTVIT